MLAPHAPAHCDADLFAEGFAFEDDASESGAPDGDGPADGGVMVAPVAPDAQPDILADSELAILAEGFSDLVTAECIQDRVRNRMTDKAMQRKYKAATRKIDELKSQLAVHVQCDALHRRRKGAWLKDQRGMDMSFRRACGWTSLRAMAVWIGDLTLDKNTLRRWEVKTSTAVLTTAALFHNNRDAALFDNIESAPHDHIRHSVFSIRGDATNNIKGEKFHVLHVESLYNVGGEREYNSIWPDPIEIVGSATGRLAWALYMRQLEQVACPAFEVADKTAGYGSLVLRSILATADAGTDQKGFQDIAENYVRPRPSVLWYHCDCLKHHSSNGTRTSLKLSDTYSKRWSLTHTLFSAVVKLFHFFSGNRATLNLLWANKFSWEAADVAFKCGLTRPTGNRWGTFDSCAGQILGFIFAELIEVVVEASSPDRKKKPGRKRNASGEPVNEIALDDVDHYRKQKGRWTNETHVSSKQPGMWLLLRISTVCRQPWCHLLNFLLENFPKLAVLIFGKEREIAAEFECRLLDDSLWSSMFDGLDHPLLTGGACPDELAANEAIVSFTACHATDFDRRITRRIDCWPISVVWMGFSPADAVCIERQIRATEFIDSQPTDSTSKKLLINFGAEFRIAAATGTCPVKLHEYATDIAMQFWPDSGDVEATNKIVTTSFSRCNNIGKQLVKARVVNKKKLFEGAHISNVLQAAAQIPALVQDCTDAAVTPEFAALRDDPDRWVAETKVPAQRPILDAPDRVGAALDALMPLADDAGAAGAVAVPAPAGPAGPRHEHPMVKDRDIDVEGREWASTWTVSWYRSYIPMCEGGACTAANLFTFRKPRSKANVEGNVAWLTGTTHFFTGLCLRLRFTSATTAAIEIPFQKWNTVEVLTNARFSVAGGTMVCDILDVDWPSRTECRIIRRRKCFDLSEVHPSDVKIRAYIKSKKKSTGGKAGDGVKVADLINSLGEDGADDFADAARGGDGRDGVLDAFNAILEEAGYVSEVDDIAPDGDEESSRFTHTIPDSEIVIFTCRFPHSQISRFPDFIFHVCYICYIHTNFKIHILISIFSVVHCSGVRNTGTMDRIEYGNQSRTDHSPQYPDTWVARLRRI